MKAACERTQDVRGGLAWSAIAAFLLGVLLATGLVQPALADEPIDINDCENSIDCYALYDGTPAIPSFSFSYDGVELVEGTDYTVEYTNNDGSSDYANAAVTGINAYTGTYYFGFNIVKATSLAMDSRLVVKDTSQQVGLYAVTVEDGMNNEVSYDGGGLTWVCADESIATVDQRGYVTGKALGSTTVTATSRGGLTASCTVTVIDISGAQFEESSYTVPIDWGFTALLYGTDDSGNPIESTVNNLATNWTSSKESVASVDDGGWVYPRSSGKTTISCSIKGKICSVEVTVVDVNSCNKLESNYSLVETYIGNDWYPDEYPWIFLVDNEGNRLPSNYFSVQFTSDDESIATVDNYSITGVSVGETTIHATYMKMDDETGEEVASDISCDIQVTVLRDGLVLACDPLITYPGIDVYQSAWFRVSSEDCFPNYTVADESIATVDEYGYFIGKKAGITTATASAGGYEKTFEVQVLSEPESLTFEKDSITAYAGSSIWASNLGLTLQPGNVRIYDMKYAEWQTDNPEVVSIDENGSLLANSVGTATVTAKMLGVSASINIKVLERTAREFVDPSGNAVMCYPILFVNDDNSAAYCDPRDQEYESTSEGDWYCNNTLFEERDSNSWWHVGTGTIPVGVMTTNALYAPTLSYAFEGQQAEVAKLAGKTEEDEVYMYEVAVAGKKAVTITSGTITGDAVYTLSEDGSTITFKDGVTPNAYKLTFNMPDGIYPDIVYGGSKRNTIQIFNENEGMLDWYLWPDSTTNITFATDSGNIKPTLELDPADAGTLVVRDSSYVIQISNLKKPATLYVNANSASISSATVSGVSNKTYTGKALKQTPVVKLGGVTLAEGTDYTVSYKNNTNAGTASVTITGKGKYHGTKTVTFTIAKAKATMTAKAAKKLQTVKFKNVKKKAQKVKKAITVSNGKGKITYTLVKANKTKKFKIDSKGVITVPKGTKKGTYSLKVKVKDAGNSNYAGVTRTVTVKIKVK